MKQHLQEYGRVVNEGAYSDGFEKRVKAADGFFSVIVPTAAVLALVGQAL